MAATLTALRARLGAERESYGPLADSLRSYQWLCTDSTLSRFLEANGNDVEKAMTQLVAHLEWRVSYGADTITDENFDDLVSHNEIYWSSSRDREGRPLLVVNVARHDSKGVSAERYARFFVHLIERGSAEYFGTHVYRCHHAQVVPLGPLPPSLPSLLPRSRDYHSPTPPNTGGPERAGRFCVIVNCINASRKHVDLKIARVRHVVIGGRPRGAHIGSVYSLTHLI